MISTAGGISRTDLLLADSSSNAAHGTFLWRETHLLTLALCSSALGHWKRVSFYTPINQELQFSGWPSSHLCVVVLVSPQPLLIEG